MYYGPQSMDQLVTGSDTSLQCIDTHGLNPCRATILYLTVNQGYLTKEIIEYDYLVVESESERSFITKGQDDAVGIS